MKRTALIALLVLSSVPAAAGSLFPKAKPCFIAGNAGYQLSDAAAAGTIIVRIDNAAAQPACACSSSTTPVPPTSC